MKKTILRLILIAVGLLPTLIAALTFFGMRKSPIEVSSLTQLILDGPSGSHYELHHNIDKDKAFIDYWIKLNENAKRVDKIPDHVSTDSPYTAVFVSKQERSTYQYYFSPTYPSQSYLIDSNKNIYQINATDTIAFLDSEYSADLYPHSTLPTLSVSENTVEASTINWTYYSYSGKGHPSSHTAQSDEIPLLTASYVGINIQSSLVPDDSQLKIIDENDSILYQGSLKDFHPATTLKKKITKDTLLHISLRTEWKESDTAHYSGSAEYRFDVQAIFDPACYFWLGSNTAELGEMVVLSGEFVEDLADLSFSSSPDLGVTPTFIQDGDYVRALLPIPRDLPTGAGEYTLTVGCLGKAYQLPLYVKPPTHSTQVRNYNYSGLVNVWARTEANLAAFRQHIASLPVTSRLYCTNPFFLNEGANIRAAYGETIHNTNSKEDDFLSSGAAIVAYPGTPIYGANNGIVVSVTTTAYGGNTVVIDHGWGLFSVYYCLGKVLVLEGQQVTTDTIIGYGGIASANLPGYTDGVTCYWELWVGGEPVSYLPLIKALPEIGTPEH